MPGGQPPIIFETNYISSEREFIGESESLKILEKIFISDMMSKQFLRSIRNLIGHFWKFEKISIS